MSTLCSIHKFKYELLEQDSTGVFTSMIFCDSSFAHLFLPFFGCFVLFFALTAISPTFLELLPEALIKKRTVCSLCEGFSVFFTLLYGVIIDGHSLESRFSSVLVLLSLIPGFLPDILDLAITWDLVLFYSAQSWKTSG